MKHIVQFSGGKDSTAMLLMMLERGMQVDEIIFCDTGKEFPQMYDHINKVEEYIDRKVTVLKAEKSFDYYMFEHELAKGEKSRRNGYGWPRVWVRWCTRVLKKDPTKKYLKNIGKYTEYIGIAYDEPKRHANIPDNIVHPLYDWGMTEAEALQYCYSKGFDWGGLYKEFGRASCWCCPLQPIKSCKTLYRNYPELWRELRRMDDRADYKFRPDYSVEQLEARFKREVEAEEAQTNLFDKASPADDNC